MATKRTLSRFSLPDRVAELLREMIVTGELASGERVPVATLAEQLSVSPTPLREALKVLAAEGIVDLLPNRGARVAPYTAEVARHLFEVIVALESHAAELAAGRMTAQDLEGLESLHREMRAFYEAGDKESYFRHNSLIHGAIVKGAYNPVLTMPGPTSMANTYRRKCSSTRARCGLRDLRRR